MFIFGENKSNAQYWRPGRRPFRKDTPKAG